MSLKIFDLQKRGNASEEYVVFEATADVNLNRYMVVDKTFTQKGKVSNVHKHPFRFPNQLVKKGEFVVLLTTKGTPEVGKMDSGEKAYAYYWGSDAAIWNDGGDQVVLMKVEPVDTLTVGKA